MSVKPNREAERDINYVIKALDIMDDACKRYGENCRTCPLGTLGAFDVPTCKELDKLKSRLKLAYGVVKQ